MVAQVLYASCFALGNVFFMKTILSLILILGTLPAFAKKISVPFMGRNFTLVIPEKGGSQKKPLLVILHGCKQSPEIILEGTQLDQAALKNDFFLLSPEQSILHNIDHCWNWFLSSNQYRSKSNEMGQIIGAIDMIAASRRIDRERIYLAGISAGGVMAHNMSVCYPDYFAGVAIHAGLSYKVAESMYEAQKVLTSAKLKSPNYLGKKAFECSRQVQVRKLTKMILIHGEEDKRVDPFHTELISKTNEVHMDYLDDGTRNNSQAATVKEANLQFPNGYAASRIDRNYKSVNFTERMYLIKGLAHAWGGGKKVSDNFDTEAPSSNELILNFLQLKK